MRFDSCSSIWASIIVSASSMTCKPTYIPNDPSNIANEIAFRETVLGNRTSHAAINSECVSYQTMYACSYSRTPHHLKSHWYPFQTFEMGTTINWTRFSHTRLSCISRMLVSALTSKMWYEYLTRECCQLEPPGSPEVCCVSQRKWNLWLTPIWIVHDSMLHILARTWGLVESA